MKLSQDFHKCRCCARIYVAGLIAGHQEAHIPPLLDKAIEAYAEFRDVKPFWKALMPAAEVPAASGVTADISIGANSAPGEEAERRVA